MPIILKFGPPEAAAFKRLYDTTVWGPQGRDAAFYEESLAGSWCCVGAYEGEQLVGFGRILSDGKLHAFITEMMVESSFQGQGIGQAVLRKLLEHCKAHGIDSIQLFAAPGKAGFYAREGFAERLAKEPGMQYIEPHDR